MDEKDLLESLEGKSYKISPEDTIQIGDKYYKFGDVERLNREAIEKMGGLKYRDRMTASFFIFWDEMIQYTGYTFYEYMRTVYSGKGFDDERKLMIPLTFEIYTNRTSPDPIFLILDTILPITEDVLTLPHEEKVLYMDLRYSKYMWLDKVFRKLYTHDYLFKSSPLARMYKDILNLSHAMDALTICFKYDSPYIEPLMDSIKEHIGEYRVHAQLSPILITSTVFNTEDYSDGKSYTERVRKIVEGNDMIVTQNVNTFITVAINSEVPNLSIYGPPDHNGMDADAMMLAADILKGKMDWPFDMEYIPVFDQIIDPEETSLIIPKKSIPTLQEDEIVVEEEDDD